MREKWYKKVYGIIVLLLVFSFVYLGSMRVEAEFEEKRWEPFGTEEFYFEWYRQELTTHSYNPSYEQKESNYIYWDNSTENTYSLKITSKNPKVLEISKEDTSISIKPRQQLGMYYSYKINGAGKATIEYKVDNAVYEENIYVAPNSIDLEKITQTGYQSAKLTWKKCEGVSGYVIERAEIKQNNTTEEIKWKTVKTVLGDNTTSAVITTKWNKTYQYRIVGFVQAEKEKLYGTTYGTTLKFKPEKKGVNLISVKKSGNQSLKISWKKDKEAIGYKIYRSEMENDGYKVVKKITKGTTTSWKQKVTKGKVYYYKIVTIYPAGESEASTSIAQMIPVDSTAKTSTLSGVNVGISGSQYGGNWASSDDIYYYQESGKLHLVALIEGGNLADYTLDQNGKVISKKIIELEYERWGGFYKGPDGNFYVAVGYMNFEESKTKTVIKVIQYDANWNKKKTAIIKGGVSNSFQGIYIPFDAGNCTMSMQGDTLYLFTAREMFETSDGLHHQSNISFVINTKSMKAKEANESYCSHSFNQLVKFKDGNLYLMDHGDAYPRSIYLHMVNNYKALQKERYNQGQGGYSIKNKEVFHFQGKIGDNYTGCTIGGMEIGKNNILVCGTSVPHNYAVSGVKGSGSGYRKNVFVTVTNKETEKNKVKWLTKYHPQNSNVIVGQTRMVKLNEDRYAILYSLTENNVNTLEYVVINNKGNKVYSKSYTNMEFKGGSQPIVYEGNIVWTETSYSSDYMSRKTKLYSIPAVW